MNVNKYEIHVVRFFKTKNDTIVPLDLLRDLIQDYLDKNDPGSKFTLLMNQDEVPEGIRGHRGAVYPTVRVKPTHFGFIRTEFSLHGLVSEETKALENFIGKCVDLIVEEGYLLYL